MRELGDQADALSQSYRIQLHFLNSLMFNKNKLTGIKLNH